MKLFHKLLILILLLSVVPLTIVGYKSMTGLQNEIKDDIQTMYRERVQANREMITRIIDVSSKKIIQAIHFRKLGDMDETQMKSFVNDLVRQFEEIDVITILDDIGNEVTSAVESSKLSPQALYAHIKTLDRKGFDKALKNNGGYSNVYVVDGVPYMTIFSPFTRGDRPAPWMVAAGLSLKSIKNLIQQIQFSKSDEGAAVLFDEKGELIDGKMKNVTPEELARFEKLSLIDRARSNRSNIDASTEEFKDPFGTEHMGAYAFITGVEWLLLISEPKERVFASADLLMKQSIGIILITLVISIVFGLMFAQRLIKPILTLMQGAKEIGEGNLDYRIEKLTNDEIGVLCDSFSDMAQSLQHREEVITQIRSIASELSTIFEKDEVISVGAKAIKELTKCSDIYAFILDDEKMVPNFHIEEKGKLPLSSEMFDELKEVKEIKEYEDRSWWEANEGGKKPESLVVPLLFNDPKEGTIMKGSIILGGESYSHLDKQVAQILSGAMTIALMNIGFLNESVDNERRAHELEIAELVQSSLYPESDPEYEQIELSSFIQSSSETGGDWYGYLESDDRKTLTVLIGDVTGHGAPAALVTSATNAFFKTVEHLAEVMKHNPEVMEHMDIYSPKFLLSILNNVILGTAHGRLVMTFFISTIDMDTGEMICANAGHNVPWIYRNDPELVAKEGKTRKVTSKDRVGARAKVEAEKAKETAGEGDGQKSKPKFKISAKKRKSGEAPATEDAPAEKPKFKISSKKRKVADSAESEVAAEEKPKFKISPKKRKVAENAESEAPAEKPKFKISSKKRKVEGAEDGGDKPKSKFKIAPKKGGVKIKKKDNKLQKWENINARGMRLGEQVTSDFDEMIFQLYKGDILVWYTDGFLENCSPDDEEFGKKRMRQALEEKFETSMKDSVDNLVNRSYEFYREEPREDDLTIILGKVHSPWGGVAKKEEVGELAENEAT